MEEILRAAIKAGFTTWGFTPHAPICLDSPCNMKKEDVENFLVEIKRLRNLYPQIEILAGMEVDYINDENGPASPEIKDYGLDYVIGSVHFVPNQQGIYFDIDGSPERFRNTLHNNFNDDLDFVVRSFWHQTQKMIRAGGFDIIGHIDKIALNASFVNPKIEDNPEYKSLAQETIDMAIASGKDIEINTKHFEKYGRFFPHPRYWNHILSHGNNMPVNSDTHYSELIEAGMSQALNLLTSLQ